MGEPGLHVQLHPPLEEDPPEEEETQTTSTRQLVFVESVQQRNPFGVQSRIGLVVVGQPGVQSGGQEEKSFSFVQVGQRLPLLLEEEPEEETQMTGM